MDLRPEISDDTITEFVGVYDADGTILGEVSYWIGARLGRAHCSLCDLTHGTFTVKREWRQCSQSLAIPFVTHHRDDAPADVLAAATGGLPAVFARGAGTITVVFGPDQLAEFGGSTPDFVDALQRFLVGR